MVSSGLLRRVALVITDVSEDPGASFIRVTKIGELGTTQAATSNRRTLRISSQRNNPEDTILNIIVALHIISFILCWGMNVQDSDMTPATFSTVYYIPVLTSSYFSEFQFNAMPVGSRLLHSFVIGTYFTVN
jgi:hypothetical protein